MARDDDAGAPDAVATVNPPDPPRLASPEAGSAPSSALDPSRARTGSPEPDARSQVPATTLEGTSADDPEDPRPTPPTRGLGAQVARWTARIDAVRRHFVPRVPEAAPSPRRRVWLLSFYVLRRWIIEDRSGGMAAQLTMQTLLSTVPFLGVALLIVGLMDPVSGNELLEDLFRSLVPENERARHLAHEAMTFAARVNVDNLGALGFLASVALSFVLFWTLEQTLNRIWRVTRRRSLLVKFTMFYTLATLGPALILYSLAEPLLAGVTRTVTLPALTTSVGLVLLNRYIPYTAVHWGPALVGGLTAAVLIELAKMVFGYYATSFALRTYEGLYGSLAIFPILIAWSYISWMVVLLGAEIAFVMQRHRTIALQGYLNRYVLERIEVPNDSGRTAARLMLAICDRFARRGEGMSPEVLGERFRLALDRVGELLGQLERHGYIIDTDTDYEGRSFVPARPLDQLRLLDVLVLFDHEQSRRPRADRLSELYRQLDAHRAQTIGDTSYADLVQRADRNARVRAP